MIGETILEAVAANYCCTVRNIKGEQRQWCEPRWIAMLMLSDIGWSYPRIGRFLGDRDHTTIMHGVSKARVLLATNFMFKRKYDAAVKRVGAVEYTA